MAAPHIGFIGIGNMGEPMAKRVLGGGYALTVFDADQAKGERLAAEIQCRLAADPADLARGADVVVTMLPNGNIVRDGPRRHRRRLPLSEPRPVRRHDRGP